MKKKITLLFFGTILVAGACKAQYHDIRGDRRDIREDRRELFRDHERLADDFYDGRPRAYFFDRHRIAEDRRDINRDRFDLARDRRGYGYHDRF